MLNLMLIAALALPGDDCIPTPNSTGLPGALEQTGSTFFTASQIPLEVYAGLCGGAYTTNLPFGDGRLCVNPALGWWRLPPAGFGDDGTAVFDATEVLTPGVVAHVQCWYRDPGFGNFGFNFTNAVTWVEP